MAKQQYTQTQQVIDTLRRNGGYSTLGNLYHLVDTSQWATKTPNESIRRIVQQSNEIFKIRPGLWALTECKKEVLKKFGIIKIPNFSFPEITNRARTVDVIWFNDRQMPNSFFEVEHSTDIQNSVTKFCDLQDFHSRFLIVAPQNRHEQFNKVMSRTVFHEFRERVLFRSYEEIIKQYELLCAMKACQGI